MCCEKSLLFLGIKSFYLCFYYIQAMDGWCVLSHIQNEGKCFPDFILPQLLNHINYIQSFNPHFCCPSNIQPLLWPWAHLNFCGLHMEQVPMRQTQKLEHSCCLRDQQLERKAETLRIMWINNSYYDSLSSYHYVL